MRSILSHLTDGALVVGRWERRLWRAWRRLVLRFRFRRQLRQLKKGLPW